MKNRKLKIAIGNLLTLYLFAIEEVRRCRSPKEIERFLTDENLYSGLCRAVKRHIRPDWSFSYTLKITVIRPYIRKGSAFICKTPSHHKYDKQKTLKSLAKRVEILQKEYHKL